MAFAAWILHVPHVSGECCKSWICIPCTQELSPYSNSFQCLAAWTGSHLTTCRWKTHYLVLFFSCACTVTLTCLLSLWKSINLEMHPHNCVKCLWVLTACITTFGGVGQLYDVSDMHFFYCRCSIQLLAFCGIQGKNSAVEIAWWVSCALVFSGTFLLAERRCILDSRFSQDISVSSRQRISEQRHWAVHLYVADLTVLMSPFKSVWTHSYLLQTMPSDYSD